MSKAAELAKMGEVITNSQIGGRRNIVINGAMTVAQRATSASSKGDADGYFTVDRYKVNVGDTSAGRFTMSQATDAPNGFANSLKIDCTTADTSIAAGERLTIDYRIEGQDLQQVKKGTADAETMTLSFYAKVAGSATDFVVDLIDNDYTRQVSKLFTFTTSWVRYYWTIPADTSGAFDNDNANSLNIQFWLHGGSTYTSGTLNTSWASSTDANRAVGIDSIFSSTSNDLYLTGVQLEVGSTATPFEHRSFGEELQLCQRYYYERMGTGTALAVSGGEYQWAMNGIAYNTTLGVGGLAFPTPMRATATLGYSAVAHFIKQTAGRGDEVTAINLYDGAENATTSTAYVQFNSSNSTAGGAIMTTQNSSARLNFDAEL